MLFNGNFIFVSFFFLFVFCFIVFLFFCYSMGYCILFFFVNFPCYSMEILHFFNFPCYSMGTCDSEAVSGGGRTDGWMEGRTDGRLEIHPCVLQDIGPLGPLPKKEKESRTDTWRDGR